jgi:hypothetical protein
LVSHLKDDQAQYAYLRVEVPVEETTRTKFVLIAWIGESTSPLKKGKVSVDKYAPPSSTHTMLPAMHPTPCTHALRTRTQKYTHNHVHTSVASLCGLLRRVAPSLLIDILHWERISPLKKGSVSVDNIVVLCPFFYLNNLFLLVLLLIFLKMPGY